MKKVKIIKFKYILKLRKCFNSFKFKLRKILFKRMFHVELYNEILDKLSNGESCIRYYKVSYFNTNNSFKHKLQEYHVKYDTFYFEDLLKEAFMFTETYIRYKISKYDDISFEYGNDIKGEYFEIKLKINN